MYSNQLTQNIVPFIIPEDGLLDREPEDVLLERKSGEAHQNEIPEDGLFDA